jgi:hypothetical protein
MISVTSEGFIVRRAHAASLSVSGYEDKARFDSESHALQRSKFRRHTNISNVARQKADPDEKHVRTRLSALIIDIAFGVDSSHLADICNPLKCSFIQRSQISLPHCYSIQAKIHGRATETDSNAAVSISKKAVHNSRSSGKGNQRPGGSKTKRAATEREVSKVRKGHQRPRRWTKNCLSFPCH